MVRAAAASWREAILAIRERGDEPVRSSLIWTE